MQELQAFARQRPGTFLLVAAGAGLLAGRLTRGVKDASSTDSSGSAHRGVGEVTPNAAVPGLSPELVAAPQRASDSGLGGGGL